MQTLESLIEGSLCSKYINAVCNQTISANNARGHIYLHSQDVSVSSFAGACLCRYLPLRCATVSSLYNGREPWIIPRDECADADVSVSKPRRNSQCAFWAVPISSKSIGGQHCYIPLPIFLLDSMQTDHVIRRNNATSFV